jgi:hypothetical protein
VRLSYFEHERPLLQEVKCSAVGLAHPDPKVEVRPELPIAEQLGQIPLLLHLVGGEVVPSVEDGEAHLEDGLLNRLFERRRHL